MQATIDDSTGLSAGAIQAAQLDTAPVRVPEGWFRRGGRAVLRAMDWVFGWVSLMVGLAVLAVIPVLNVLSLGYLLHVTGRVAITGRLRDGLVGLPQAAVVGRIVAGAWLVFLPIRLVSGLWRDAELVAPGSGVAQGWRVGLWVLAVLAAGQVLWATVRGGRFRHFLWPAPRLFFRWVTSCRPWGQVWRPILEYGASLRLDYYFWLGFRGLVGSLAWLAIPVGLLIWAAQLPAAQGGGILSLAGGLGLVYVAIYLPFLQARFALQNRLAAFFELGPIRQWFIRAPVAFCLTGLVTVVLALPLYLLKIELPPREIAWLPSLVFVLFMFPARLLTGWAVGRACRRQLPRHGFFRWASRLVLLLAALLYVVFVYATQYLSWDGSWSLLEQHAFLVFSTFKL
jgi:hypothetical protein